MPGNILFFTKNNVDLINPVEKHCAEYNLSIYKTTDFEMVIRELKRGHYLMIVVSLNHENKEQIQTQIKMLRSLTTIPIAVMAEEPVDVSIKIDTLNEGADQIYEPPIIIEEAAAASLALIRRFSEFNKIVKPVTIYYDHGILISIDHRKVFIGEKEIDLLRKEFDILSLLVRNHARVLTYEQIFKEVWGEDYADNSKDLLWSQICRLRDKLRP